MWAIESVEHQTMTWKIFLICSVINSELKFTTEEEQNNKFNFLYFTLIKRNNQVRTIWNT